MALVRELFHRFPRLGRLEWIGVRPARREPVRSLLDAALIEGRGIEGDRYAANETPGDRQVTLIQAEHLEVMAKLLGEERIDPALLRRNLVVSGINLVALRRARFRIGLAVLEGVDDCHPCSRMEEALGRGGYNAMRGHGGILARVVETGVVRVGDAVVFLEALRAPEPDPP